MVKIPTASICDMNCFLPPNHVGKHQFQLQEDYEKKMCNQTEKMILVRTSHGGYWSEWKTPFEDVVQEQKEYFNDNQRVRSNPCEVIEVEVTRRATIKGEVTVEYK